MNETIKKRIMALEKAILPHAKSVIVEWADGAQEEIDAGEWWEHRFEWPLADLRSQGNSGGLVACLIFAALADEAIEKAENAEEVERLTAEREKMLSLYFGDGEA